MNNREEWISYFTLMNGRAPSEEEIAAAQSEWQDPAETPTATSQPTTISNPQIGAAMTAEQPTSAETQANQTVNQQTTAETVQQEQAVHQQATAETVQQEQAVIKPAQPVQPVSPRPTPARIGRKQKLKHKAAQMKRAHNVSAQTIQQTNAQPTQASVTPEQPVQLTAAQPTQAPVTPQQPVQPTAAQPTQAPVTPQQAVQPTAAQPTQAPVTPQQPVQPTAAQPTQAPVTPQQAVQPTVAQPTQVPVTPQQEVQPTAAQPTQAPVTPQQPVQPTATQVTQAPVTPQQPVQPTAAQPTQAPVTPQQAVQPTAAQPTQAPVTPQQPVQPTAAQPTQAPVTPQQPVQPTAAQPTQAPVTPGQPAQPTAAQPTQAPVTPQQPVQANTAQSAQAPIAPSQPNQLQQVGQNGLTPAGQAPMPQGQPVGMQQKPDPNLLMQNYENARPFVRFVKFFSTGAWLTGRGWANAFTPGRGLGIIVAFLSFILSIFWIIVAFNAGAGAKLATMLGTDGPIGNALPKSATSGVVGFRFIQIFAILLAVAMILFSVNYLARIVKIKGYSWIITGLLGASFIASMWVRFVSLRGFSQAVEIGTKSYPLNQLMSGVVKALRGPVGMPANFDGGTLNNAVQGFAAQISYYLKGDLLTTFRSGVEGTLSLWTNTLVIAILTAVVLGIAIFGFVKGWAKKHG